MSHKDRNLSDPLELLNSFVMRGYAVHSLANDLDPSNSVSSSLLSFLPVKYLAHPNSLALIRMGFYLLGLEWYQEGIQVAKTLWNTNPSNPTTNVTPPNTSRGDRRGSKSNLSIYHQSTDSQSALNPSVSVGVFQSLLDYGLSGMSKLNLTGVKTLNSDPSMNLNSNPSSTAIPLLTNTTSKIGIWDIGSNPHSHLTTPLPNLTPTIIYIRQRFNECLTSADTLQILLSTAPNLPSSSSTSMIESSPTILSASSPPSLPVLREIFWGIALNLAKQAADLESGETSGSAEVKKTIKELYGRCWGGVEGVQDPISIQSSSSLPINNTHQIMNENINATPSTITATSNTTQIAGKEESRRAQRQFVAACWRRWKRIK